MNSSLKFSHPFFRDIRFYIALAFLVRLIGITNPPLEISHNWRQVTGLMVSRNYLETDPSFIYPRIDDAGTPTGIIGMEFPVMNYLYFIFAKLFGYTHWYGRLINLLVSSFGIYFFYLLVKKYINEKTAFLSTLFLFCSIWFSFSRKMMPDTFCISLMLPGIYFGLEYLEFGKIKHWILFFLFAGLGILSKIPAGIYFALLLYPVIAGKYPMSRKITISISGLVIICFVYAWYFYWNVHLVSTFGGWYNSGKSLSEGFFDIRTHLGEFFEKFYFSAFDGFILFGCFLAGLVLIFRKKDFRMQYVFLSVFVFFLLYIFKSGYFFFHHNYYIIPFVPVMALLSGYFVSHINKKWIVLFLIAGGITESVANQQHDFFIKKSEIYKSKLESIADSVSQRNDLIVINGNMNPQQIYLSHRKGFTCTDAQLLDSTYLKSIAVENCRYVFINKHTFQGTLPLTRVYRDDDFDVFKLTKSHE